MRRRTFLGVGLGVAAGGAALFTGCSSAARRKDGASGGEQPDSELRALAEVALEAARAAGASYADCRIVALRRQLVATREARVTDVQDGEQRGFGVRVIADGAWGFAASPRLARDELAAVARRAVALARSSARLASERVELAAAPARVGVWRTPVRRDPFEVGLDEKIDLQLRINAAALETPGVSFCRTSMDFVREHKLFASSEGTCVEQTLLRCNPGFTVTAVDRARGFETRDSFTSPQGMGWEYVEDYPWLDDARQAGRDALDKLDAKSVEPGPRDLVLHPSNLWLTIHESIGHSTELDRALGMEANNAGTSFLTPDKLGTFRVGSELVGFEAERVRPGGLATAGWDDDGVATARWPLVERGIFVGYQTIRDQARFLGQAASRGCSLAQSWHEVAFQRMPNVNLLPGAADVGLDELIADTEDGILIQGRGSYSIDHQRYNFQFGGQTYHAIEKGRVSAPLRDVAYQARTPDFWGACDALGGERACWSGGSFYDGKGEPGQSNAVSHRCPPARFRQIRVLNTARSV